MSYIAFMGDYILSICNSKIMVDNESAYLHKELIRQINEKSFYEAP